MLAFKGKGVIRIIIKMRLEEIRKKFQTEMVKIKKRRRIHM